jgi:hypothetical protein
MQYTPNQIPNFVQALSPLGLRRAMLMNNSRLGMYIHYFDIQQATVNGKTVWVAWFNETISDDKALKEFEGVK